MAEEFILLPAPKKHRKGKRRSKHNRRLKIPRTWIDKNQNKAQAFRSIIKSGDRILFTRALRITKVVVIDCMHKKRVVPRSPSAYLEVQLRKNGKEFRVAGAGTMIEKGQRLYFRCRYVQYKVKVWFRRPPIYIWPWLIVDE